MYYRFQFIPQLIFLNSLFGYLSLLIIVKWCTGATADLYHVMIYMFLSPTDDLGENQLFPGQKTLQVCAFFFLNNLLHEEHLLYEAMPPACTAPPGLCFSSMDVTSQAISLEEATWTSMFYAICFLVLMIISHFIDCFYIYFAFRDTKVRHTPGFRPLTMALLRTMMMFRMIMKSSISAKLLCTNSFTL